MWQILLLLFFSCSSPPSLERLQKDAEKELESLFLLLEPLSSPQELEEKLPAVRKKFLHIASLLVQARSLHLPERDPSPTLASEKVFLELCRLYEIAGCKELLEEAQKEALFLLQS